MIKVRIKTLTLYGIETNKTASILHIEKVRLKF